MYKVSVIIPMYNREYIIGRALDSALAQTLDDVEIIVVDDGSQDGSVDLVKRYQKKHDNIKLLVAQHGGPGPARNLGIAHATGKYLAFLDSDDFIPENAYQLMYDLAEEKACDVVIGQLLRKIDTVQNGKWHSPAGIAKVIRSHVGENCAGSFDIMLENPSMWNRFINRAFWIENGLEYNDQVFGEDFVCNYNLFRAAKSIYTVDEVVYCYETSYSDASSTISSIKPNIVISGLASAKDIAMKFDAMGRVDWEIQFLTGYFSFALDRFWKLDGTERNEPFEKIKEILRVYQGRREYAIPIEACMGLDLDTLLLLPYKGFEICRALAAKKRPAAPPRVVTVDDPKTKVLLMYQNGEIGFRYIIKYFIAWFKFKIGRRKT